MGNQSFCCEVTDLHALFERAFTEGDADGGLMTNFATRMHESFWLIDPRGVRRDRDAIVEAVSRRVGSGPITIEVDQCCVVAEATGLTVGTYVEKHTTIEYKTERHATVGMRPDTNSPSGWTWLFVHETWVSQEAASSGHA